MTARLNTHSNANHESPPPKRLGATEAGLPRVGPAAA